MQNLDALLLTVLLTALAVAAAAAHGIAGRYRKAMLHHMGAAPSAPAASPAPPTLLETPPRARFDLPLNRRQTRRLSITLTAISALIGLSCAAFELLVVHTEGGFGGRKLILLALTYTWPVVPALGLLWRWSMARTVIAVALYLAALAPLILLGSNAEQSLRLVTTWLASTTVLPLIALFGLTASGRIRAIAPLLFPPALLMTGASWPGIETLAASIDAPPDALVAMVDGIGAIPTIAVFALAPWLVGVWPALAVVRAVARAYRAKRFSELAYLFGMFWLVVLISMAIPSLHSTAGAGALAIVLAWLWVPIGFGAARDWLAPPRAAPTLLVLRVFRRDAAVEALFDAVTERWRASGNTVLIAGTDLVTRTLDPDDLFVFLSRRLGERFITRAGHIPDRLAGFDMAPDHDGRYRINECYCNDTTWQPTLNALLQRSDAVLMDLRDFTAANAGCRFELDALAGANHVGRIAILFNAATDRRTAEADLGAATARCQWIEVPARPRGLGRRVLAALATPA
ncbi:MAG: hypothetical protein KDE68_01425 [Rhodocyclaceae bacterium]|nr:hypothetical protein [Rhodocyclaceae bacterium]